MLVALSFGQIHFVHYNSDKYADVASAAATGDPNALAVLGVLVDVRITSLGCRHEFCVRTVLSLIFEIMMVINNFLK